MPTLLFLHGGPGFRDYLKPYFDSMADNFNCVFFDQVRGPDLQITAFIEQIDGLVQTSPGNVVLIGHSWGGVLATHYASLYQKKLAGLVLMNTGLKATQWKDEFRTELKTRGLEDAGPEKIFLTADELELGRPLLNSTWSSFCEETFNSLNASYLKDFDLTQQISELQIPILNIFGENDIRFPRRVAKSIRSFNDRITDFEIPGAGHFSFLLPDNRKIIIDLLTKTFSA